MADKDEKKTLVEKMEKVTEEGCDFCVGTKYQAVETEDDFASLLRSLGKEPVEE